MRKNYILKHLRTLCLTLTLLIVNLLVVVAQDVAVSGKVTGSGGAGLPGVSVYQKGKTTTGTNTDATGSYKISVASGSTLVFRSVGMKTQEITVGNQSALNVTMSEDINSLSDVFITATSQPVRKIETVTAVESIGAKQLARINPINLTDAIRYVPGVYVQTQSGRVRNSIFMRGFPDVSGNGLGYTSLLYDGLRTFASPEAVPDASFRYDMNIDRIEVVRGSAATLYGRGAAAGAVNVISRTGGEELSGAVRMTVANNAMRQFDFNLNGSLNESKSLRFNVGGFLMRDLGLRNNLYPDEGGQVRGNIDYFLPDNQGKVRVYGGIIDLNIQNQIDIPYLSNDFSKPAPGWSPRDVFVPRSVFVGKPATLTNPDGSRYTIDQEESQKKGNYSKGKLIGYNIDLKLGSGWTLISKGRYQDMGTASVFDFGLSTIWGPNPAANSEVYLTRALFSGGSAVLKDFINEARLNKQITTASTVHNLTFGQYYSTINTKIYTPGVLYALDARSADNNQQVGYRLSPTLALPSITSLFRNGDYTETVNSVFAGDEMKFNDKLTVSVGARYDWIKMNLVEDRYAYQRFASRRPEHQDWSGSVGINYMIDDNTAIYGNLVRAYRAPDYGAYTTVQYAYINADDPNKTPLLLNPTAATFPKDPTKVITTDEQGRTLYMNPYIDNNEIVNSVEVGFRKSSGDLSFDGGLFYNTIANRLITTYIGALAVSVPGGNNKIVGTELSLIYTPSRMKGLFVRSSLTAQSATYTKLTQELSPTRKIDVANNKTANVPSTIWNTSIGYENSTFGFNLNNNFIGARFADPHNTISYPGYSLVDANVYYNFKIADGNRLRVKLSGYNLLDNQSAGNIISAVTDNYLLLAKEANFSGTFSQVRGVPIIPRRIFASLEFNF